MSEEKLELNDLLKQKEEETTVTEVEELPVTEVKTEKKMKSYNDTVNDLLNEEFTPADPEKLDASLKEYGKIMEETNYVPAAIVLPSQKKRDLSEFKEAKPEEMLPPKEKIDIKTESFNREMNFLDTALNRKKEEITMYTGQIREKINEIKVEKELEELGSNTVTDNSPVEEISSNNDIELAESKEEIDISLDNMDDFGDALDLDNIANYAEEDLTEEERDVIRDNYRNTIRGSVKPIKDSLDLSTFKIATKSIGVSKILTFGENKVRTADWGLYDTGISIVMSELSGPEIEMLDPDNNDLSSINAKRNMFNILFTHLVHKNSKDTLESWLKTISFTDVKHLFFALFRACFNGANYTSFICEKCKKSFIKEIPTEDMVKYKNNEVESEMKKIRAKDSSVKKIYETNLKQISDNYAFSFKIPSIYTIVFENGSLSESITSRFSAILGTLAFIDQVYYIDREKQLIIPVDMKPDPENIAKTALNRIGILYKILNQLNSDQYANLEKETTKFASDNYHDIDDIQYRIPEVECPHCKNKIAEQITDPQTLLFIRHRLTIL